MFIYTASDGKILVKILCEKKYLKYYCKRFFVNVCKILCLKYMVNSVF